MKGFVLKKGNQIIYGGADSGVVDILVSNKQFYYRLNFGGMNADHIPYTWLQEQLTPGDRISISCEEFDTPSSPVRLGNGENTSDDDLLLLKEYERLKQELIKDGQLAPDYNSGGE